MKKRIVSLIVLFLTILIIFSGCTKPLSKEKMIELLGTDKIPTKEMHVFYTFDMTILANVVGDVDYVFVALVKDYIKTEYIGDDYPRTYYLIDVIENIKGELIKDNSIELIKSGGIDKKGKTFYVYEDDYLPKINEYYIFSVYAQPNGDILSSGINTGIFIEKRENYKNDAEYSKIITAYENQNITNRQRFISKYDVNYNS